MTVPGVRLVSLLVDRVTLKPAFTRVAVAVASAVADDVRAPRPRRCSPTRSTVEPASTSVPPAGSVLDDRSRRLVGVHRTCVPTSSPSSCTSIDRQSTGRARSTSGTSTCSGPAETTSVDRRPSSASASAGSGSWVEHGVLGLLAGLGLDLRPRSPASSSVASASCSFSPTTSGTRDRCCSRRRAAPMRRQPSSASTTTDHQMTQRDEAPLRLFWLGHGAGLGDGRQRLGGRRGQHRWCRHGRTLQRPLDVGAHLGGGLVAVVGVLGQRLHHDRVDLGRRASGSSVGRRARLSRTCW